MCWHIGLVRPDYTTYYPRALHIEQASNPLCALGRLSVFPSMVCCGGLGGLKTGLEHARWWCFLC